MSGRDTGAGAAFEAIARALDEPAGRASFLRGLTLGALVGAAIVGSLLRARRARSARRAEPAAGPLEPVDGVSLPEGLPPEPRSLAISEAAPGPVAESGRAATEDPRAGDPPPAADEANPPDLPGPPT